MSDSFFRKAIQDKMGEGNAQPGNELWGNIEGALAQKRAAKLKHTRFLLFGLLPLFLIGLSFSIFYFSQNKIDSTKVENQKIIAENNEKPEDIINERTEQVLENLELKENEILKNEQNVPVEINDSNIELKKGKRISSSQNVVPVAEISNPSNPSSTQSFFDKNEIISERQNSKTELLQKLTFEPQYLEIEKIKPTFLKSNISDFKIEKVKTRKQNFSISINYGVNQLAYCFDEKANNETAQIKLGYRFHKYFSANLGLGFHNVNYNFQVDSFNHIASFGSTDKYPSFYKLKNDVAQIESRLSYFTLPVSLNFHLPITNRLTATLTANQDFVYNQDQLLIYSFKSGADDLEFRETPSKLDLGFTTFRLGLDYPIMDGLKAEVGFNRIITFQTLGIERQYYHGFGGDFGLRYDF